MKPLQRGTYRVEPGDDYDSPKSVWGFRTGERAREPLNKVRAEAIAREFLAANATLLGIRGLVQEFRERIIESLGAFHVIFQQEHLGLKIHRAFVTAHLDHRGRVFLAKNRAVPKDRLPAQVRFTIDAARAQSIARRHISSQARHVKSTHVEQLWYWSEKRLHPAWKIRVHRMKPRCEWIVFVDAETRQVLYKWDNLALAPGRRSVASGRKRARAAARPARARASGLEVRIFDPNPVVGAPEWDPILPARRNVERRPRRPPPEAYRTCVLTDLDGSGHFDGRRASTRSTPRRIRYRAPSFSPASDDPGFEEAMAYYHVDRAIAYLESLGYRGRRAIFQGPVDINARGTRDDNSWYSPESRSLTFGTGSVDDAEDAEVILHELGHGIQDFICRDFGQSPEAAAMGEGFGDYFAASFFAVKKPKRFRDCVMSWDGVWNDEFDPPCQRPMVGDRTYADFDHDPDADEHVNGMIWSATLWDIWKAVGRSVADRIVIESHFQLDGFTSFVRGARAILDADRNLFAGRHEKKLLAIFHRRRIGPVT